MCIPMYTSSQIHFNYSIMKYYRNNISVGHNILNIIEYYIIVYYENFYDANIVAIYCNSFYLSLLYSTILLPLLSNYFYRHSHLSVDFIQALIVPII